MQPLSLLALYEGYVTRYRGWERRGTIPLKRLRQVERHHKQVVGFLEQQERVNIAASDFSFEQATHFFAWLTVTQQYTPVRAGKHLQRVQRVLWWGVEQGYLARNPLAGFSCLDGVKSPSGHDLKQALVRQLQEQWKPPPESRLGSEQIQYLGKLRIVFGFVKCSLGRACYQALCEQLEVESLAAEQAGRLRVTLEVLGRDQHRFHSSIAVTRQSWDFKKQRANGPGSEQINQQVAAFISLQYKLFIDLIERRKALTAQALVRAYRSQNKSR